MEKIQCAVCKKELLRKDSDEWCFHNSFPGPVCLKHYGVEKEYKRLLEEANDKLIRGGIIK